MSVPPDILPLSTNEQRKKMGYTTASSLAEEVSLDAGLAYHLQANHYPPVPVAMVDACIATIEAYQDEDYQRLIELPAGVSWRGETSAPASAIAEAHHLDAWLPHAHYCDCEECIVELPENYHY